MMYLTAAQSGHVLGVDPSTLRTWEDQFGFPRSRLTRGRITFLEQEVDALQRALAQSPSVSAAIVSARRSCLRLT